MTLRVHPDDIVANSSDPLLGKHPSWRRVRIREIANIRNGFAFKSAEFNSTGEGVPLIRIRDVGRDETDTFFSGGFDDEYWVDPGDLIIGMDGDFRVARWQGPRALLNQRVCRLRVFSPETYDLGFLLHVLPAYLDAIGQHTSSVTVKHLSSRTVADIPVPLPSREEQRRIVDAIEEQFSRLDAAEATLTQVIGRLGLYRRSALNALADEAPLVRMGDVLSDPLANGRSVRTRPGGFPVLRLTAVRDGRIDVRATKPGDWTESDAAKHVVHDGDFLIIRGNGSLSLVGRGGLVEREPVNPVAYPDTLIRARVRRDICEPHFLRLVWDSSVVRRQVEKTARTTAGIYKINQEDLAGLLLPLPSIAEQQDRTASAERRLSLLDALHEQVEVVRRRAGSLRRSLLACAFSGSLVKREGGH